MTQAGYISVKLSVMALRNSILTFKRFEMKKNILILGYFGYLSSKLHGQSVRTRNVYELIKKETNSIANVEYFDTSELRTEKIGIIKMFKKIASSDMLIYIPAQNSLTFFFPFIYLICKFKNINILYIAIGGWLAEYLNSKKLHAYLLSKVDGILVQSNQLKEKLTSIFKYNNVINFPNFRIQSHLPTFEGNNIGLKIVFMARISKYKGIDVVFRLAEYIDKNSKYKNEIIIDFYGPIDHSENKYFFNEISKHACVSYKGVLAPQDIYSVLEKYDLLVLPTRYSGEGFPGTILDAYMSGLPVVVSNWKYLPEFVDEGKTGFIFNLENEDEFHQFIDVLYRDRTLLSTMKKNAFEKSKLYSPDYAWNILKEFIVKKHQ